MLCLVPHVGLQVADGRVSVVWDHGGKLMSRMLLRKRPMYTPSKCWRWEQSICRDSRAVSGILSLGWGRHLCVRARVYAGAGMRNWDTAPFLKKPGILHVLKVSEGQRHAHLTASHHFCCFLDSLSRRLRLLLCVCVCGSGLLPREPARAVHHWRRLGHAALHQGALALHRRAHEAQDPHHRKVGPHTTHASTTAV